MGMYGKGHLGVSCLRGLMAVEGMSCERRWARWALRGTGTARFPAKSTSTAALSLQVIYDCSVWNS